LQTIAQTAAAAAAAAAAELNSSKLAHVRQLP